MTRRPFLRSILGFLAAPFAIKVKAAPADPFGALVGGVNAEPFRWDPGFVFPPRTLLYEGRGLPRNVPPAAHRLVAHLKGFDPARQRQEWHEWPAETADFGPLEKGTVLNLRFTSWGPPPEPGETRLADGGLMPDPATTFVIRLDS